MRHFFLIIVLVGFLILDGMILPAFGLTTGAGPLVVLAALILSFGFHRPVIGWGFVLSFFMELYFGLYFGILLWAWLVILWTWYGLDNFFSFKPIYENESWAAIALSVFAGLILFVAGELGMWVFIRLVYNWSLSLLTVGALLRSPEILAVTIGEFLILFVLIRIIYARQRANWYG